MFEVNNFDKIQISLASPETIRSWANNLEVTKPETINYRTQKPEPDGLFCQKIFGPVKDWECACGKYKRIRHKGVTCDKCGVTVTQSRVRRERMGYIQLATPVAHLWYLKGTPSRIATILEMGPKELESVVYYANWVVLNHGASSYNVKDVITEKQRLEALSQNPNDEKFRVGMGAEAIKELLMNLDLEEEARQLRESIKSEQARKERNDKSDDSTPKLLKDAKRLEIIEAFIKTGSKPEWMILEALPVMPPELRPMVPLDGGRYATSDINELYRFVISRNKRLKNFLSNGSVDMMVRNEKRLVQVAVDNLIDSSKKAKSNSGGKTRELKSLTTILKGKQGRFRQNLLGKRVDYSGRSVIVVGPELKLYQCGLPKEMALELFKPFVMKALKDRGVTDNIKQAKHYIERMRPEVWDALEDVIKDHPVLLNRAPTLHRLGIQAFEPVLVEGRAIKLHPLVCGPFNADFDGDQMAVHVPLSIEAQAEARFLMLSTNNILKLSDGKPIISPTQDMVLGSFYLTMEKDGGKGEGMCFMSPEEAKMAYANKFIELQSKIYVRVTKEIDGKTYSKRLHTTVGKIIFNEYIPQDLHFVDRKTPEDMLDLEITKLVDKKVLQEIVERCFRYKGSTETAKVLDAIKSQGYKYSTISGITTSVYDMHIPKEKNDIIQSAGKEVSKTQKLFDRGVITNDERYEQVKKIWETATNDVTDALKKCWDNFNPIKMMMDSGARGNINQIRQLAGMRGLVNDPSGRVLELPVTANYREGLDVLSYFISSHGGRKGLADTALKTSESGYLTRRLVDVAQPVIIKSVDCGDTKGTVVERIVGDKGDIIETLKDRLIGRYSIKAVCDKDGNEIIPADTLITEEQAKAVENAGITKVTIRTVLSCKRGIGVCAKCYGSNMASGFDVKVGEPVGVIAAQSIGEPGTQLTMRNFHTGGVASSEDITRGLPRVEELFEARTPKNEAVLSEIAGTVHVVEKDKKFTLEVVNDATGDSIVYSPAMNAKILVKDGQKVEPGTPMTHGAWNLQTLLATRGVRGVEDYLIKEVKDTYRLAGVAINDKHIEIIIRQMLRKVRVRKQGDSEFLPGELVDIAKMEETNQALIEQDKEPATTKRTLLGIAKAAIASESFLAAASFQETTKVLTDAAIKGKCDSLVGLKENILLGKLIPCGTGLKMYNNVNVVPAVAAVGDPIVAPYGEEEVMSDIGYDYEQDFDNDEPDSI